MMLVGGGLAGPILMGIILGLTATRLNTDFDWLKQRPSLRDVLSNMWVYVYIVSVVSWFALWPGLVILGVFVPVTEPIIVIILTLISFISMLLVILSSFAYDSREMGSKELGG